jgi:hypothetical protein
VTDATEAIAFIRLCEALGISTDKYDFVTAVLLAATRIERLEAKIPKLNVDLAEASMHAYDGEVARMKLTAERDDWKADAERLIQLANFNHARAGEYFDLHEQLVKKYEVKE